MHTWNDLIKEIGRVRHRRINIEEVTGTCYRGRNRSYILYWSMHMDCSFCEFDENLKSRIFYKKGNWVAVLAAPYHTTGHTILIRNHRKGAKCPQGLGKSVLSGMDSAIANVSNALNRKYNKLKPKDILFASLRGDVKHFHVHLFPLWEKEERKWRTKQIENNHLCYEKGHLLEYLGDLEREGDKRASKERCENGWTEKEQRDEIANREKFKVYLKHLREFTKYRE